MSPTLSLLLLALVAHAAAFTVSPMPTNCPQGNTPFWGALQSGLDQYNYVESEHYISGVGAIYAFNTTTAPFYVVNTGATTAYTLRIVVRQPADPSKFDGNVLLEYFNPTTNLDSDFVWMYTSDYIMRSGKIHVAVTLKTVPAQYLVTWNPCRYANISMPSLGAFPDMTRDLGNKLKSTDSDNPLLGLNIRALVLTSYSQSGGQVVTFANFFHQTSRTPSGAYTFDGYYLSDPTTNGAQDPATATRYQDVRRTLDFSSINVPTIRVRSEELLNTELGPAKRAPVRQAQSSIFRNYEVAGAAHLNAFVINIMAQIGIRDNTAADQFGLVPGMSPPDYCVYNDTDYPFQNFLMKNVADIFDWINNYGTFVPADNTLITLSGPIPADSQTTLPEPTIVRDQYANAEGGLRLSQLAVPTKTFSIVNPGVNPAITEWCNAVLRGTTFAFSPQTEAYLYPTASSYVEAVINVTDTLVAEGYLLQKEANEDIAAACVYCPSCNGCPNSPSVCAASITITQSFSNGWQSGNTHYSQWDVTVSTTTKPVTALTIQILPPTGSSIVSSYEITPVSGSTNLYTVQDWHFSQGLPVPTNYQMSFGYTVSSVSAAAITVASATCSA